MTMHTIPVSHAAARTDFLSHPLQALSITLAKWKARRRRRADLALLMSMEPHMLRDIGVSLAEPRGPGAMLQLHPAVLATTLQPTGRTPDEDL